MIAALLAWVLHTGTTVAGTALAPRVANISFADLVRFADLIAIGTVERIQKIEWKGWKPLEQEGLGLVSPPLPPIVPFAEVAFSQVLKGEPGTDRIAFLAAGTWTCDITSAKVGERALFFLARAEEDEIFDDQMRHDMAARFSGIPVTRILWSGRGKMPLRNLPDGEYATYWHEVCMPEGIPRVAGPDPDYSFIHSAPLSALAEEIAACASRQKERWLTATVTDVLDRSSAWELELAWDRRARLLVHEPSGAREERFVLGSSEAVGVAHLIEAASWNGCPEVVGSGRPARGVRTLTVLGPKEPVSVRILAPDRDWMRRHGGEGVRLVLDAWSTLRGSFDEPSCADHRPDDEPWLKR